MVSASERTDKANDNGVPPTNHLPQWPASLRLTKTKAACIRFQMEITFPREQLEAVPNVQVESSGSPSEDKLLKVACTLT